MTGTVKLWAIFLIVGFLALFSGHASKAHAGGFSAVSWSDVAARALPATVSIQVTKVALDTTDSGNGAQTVPGERSEFVGSGFIVDPSGIIVTNKHVIDGALHIEVMLQDGSVASARVLGGASLVDLALLKIDAGHPLSTLSLGDSESVKPGDAVLAIGDPLGVGTSLSAGIVSGTQRDLMNSPFDDYIQTDAAINHGNSGGPLLDSAGNVVGVNSTLYTNEDNEGSIGVGFAISSNVLSVVLQHLLHPPARFGWIGVHVQGVTPDLAKAFDAPISGIIVADVEQNSAASRAGLKPGDVIVSVDGNIPRNARSMLMLIATSPIGSTLTLGVKSATETRDVPVTVRAWPGVTGPDVISLQDPRCLPPPDPDLGLLLEPVTPLERKLYDLDDSSGLVVVAVNPTSEAYSRGFRPGVIIKQINREPVNDRASAEKILNDAAAHSSRVAILAEGSKGTSWFILHINFPSEPKPKEQASKLTPDCSALGGDSVGADADFSKAATKQPSLK